MRKYIVFNIEKRTNAADSFEKNFLKLVMNTLFGKIIENLLKKITVRLVNNEKDFLKYTCRPTYITHKTLLKKYAAIHEIKPVLTLKQANLCWIYCFKIKHMVNV